MPKQLVIPGLPPPAPPKPKRTMNIHQRVNQLEQRVLQLEVALTLLAGDNDHA